MDQQVVQQKILKYLDNVGDPFSKFHCITLKQLTPEEESQIPIINEKWINLALGGKTKLEYSKELQFGINWLYEKANQKNTNPLIIIAPSPYAAQLIANVLNKTSLPILKNLKLGKKINNICATNYDTISKWAHSNDHTVFRNSIGSTLQYDDRRYENILDKITISASYDISNSVIVDILQDCTSYPKSNIKNPNIENPKIDVWCDHVSVHAECFIRDRVLADIKSPNNHPFNLSSIVKIGIGDSKNNVSKTRVSISDYIINLIAKGIFARIGEAPILEDVLATEITETCSDVKNKTTISAEANIFGKISCDILDSIKFDKLEYFTITNLLSDLCGRIAYLDYFDSIGVLKHGDFNRFRNILKLGIWSAFFFENVAILTMTPSKVLHDDRNRLHSVTEPAIQFRDGYSICCIHDTKFDEKIFYDLTQRKIPVKDILQLENIEQRYVALEYYGFENILDELNARLIDESPRGNKLYEIGFEVGRKRVTTKFLKYSCPSTERNYGSFVKPEITRADQAMAWKHNCTEKEYEVLRIEA